MKFDNFFSNLFDANDKMFRDSHYPYSSVVSNQKSNLDVIAENLSRLKELKYDATK